jgi:hypothetical protein
MLFPGGAGQGQHKNSGRPGLFCAPVLRFGAAPTSPTNTVKRSRVVFSTAPGHAPAQGV